MNAYGNDQGKNGLVRSDRIKSKTWKLLTWNTSSSLFENVPLPVNIRLVESSVPNAPPKCASAFAVRETVAESCKVSPDVGVPAPKIEFRMS